MSPQSEDSTLTNILEEITNTIDHIFQLQPMTPELFMHLFSGVYNYCSNSKTLLNSGGEQATSEVVGEKLYINIKNYLTDRLQKIYQNAEDLSGNYLLNFYAQQWTDYQVPSKVLDGICSYLNNNWISISNQNTKKDIYKIFLLCYKIWENIMFQPLQEKITKACLSLIQSERNNETINTYLISQVIQNYVALSFDLRIYKEYFEGPFLRDTEQFYRFEAANFLQHNPVIEYLRKIEKRLEEEEHRVQSYLHSWTLKPLITTVEEVLIRDHLDVILLEAKNLLENDRDQDLALLFRLLDRIPDAVVRLQKVVEDHIHQTGLRAIENLPQTELIKPDVYIETILELYRKYLKLVQTIFNNRKEFTTALDNACVKFINHNALTNTTDNSRKSPEFLARYCDIILRKGKRTLKENESETKLADIMAIFNFMNEKDVFEKFYRKCLSKRLIGQLSASDDHEGLMITKLKVICGWEYTSKLQKMFEDNKLSKDLTNEYQSYCQVQPLLTKIDVSMMVLTANFWPISVAANVNLPMEIQRIHENIFKFYCQKHTGRRLTWLHQYSSGELFAHFREIPYIIEVSTYQMIVLLLFNQRTSWTVQQIQDQTQIQVDLLSPILTSILKIKLLICDQIQQINEEHLPGDYQIKLVNNFRQKNTRTNINHPLKPIEQRENENTYRTIDEDRKYIIQAAIVRIMKARKTLTHTSLIDEVIGQLNARFQPKVPDIKKCIERLLEQNYIKRDETKNNVFHYVA